VKVYHEVEGQGPPLLLHHGLSGSSQDWRTNGYVAGLRNDYRVIVLDARRHGNSDKPHDPEAYAEETRVGDVTAVLDALGIDSCHFFGYSLGGIVGLRVAKYVPQRIRSVIVGGAGTSGATLNTLNPSRRKLLEAGPEAVIAAWEKAEGVPMLPECKAQVRASDFIASIAMQDCPWPGVETDLPSMTTPFLIFAGEADSYFANRDLRTMFKGLPNAALFTLPGLDHFQAYVRGDLVLPYAKEFLTRVGKK
jgi:pimeloyl-ACP methyl ester carboxylesterase